MTFISKILLTGAVSVAAIAISAAPSEAAKRKAKSAALCVPTTLCASGGATGVNRVNICGWDGKWYQALFTPNCLQPYCPVKCS